VIHDEEGTHTVSCLTNIHRMPQIGTVLDDEAPGGCVDRILKISDVYRMRSKGDMTAWWPM
jgi:hypothetical protein